MYSDQVLDHFLHPRYVGELGEEAEVVEGSNPACGDVLRLWAVVRDGVLVEATFKASGCVAAVACGSWLTENIRGRPLSQLTGMPPDHLEAELGGLPPGSRHAAVLASDVLKRLLSRLLYGAGHQR